MSLRELDRLKWIQAFIDGALPARRAAERLAMSTRPIRRLADRYRNEGPVGLISRRCRRPSNDLAAIARRRNFRFDTRIVTPYPLLNRRHAEL